MRAGGTRREYTPRKQDGAGELSRCVEGRGEERNGRQRKTIVRRKNSREYREGRKKKHVSTVKTRLIWREAQRRGGKRR